jgi:hypothetical protein
VALLAPVYLVTTEPKSRLGRVSCKDLAQGLEQVVGTDARDVHVVDTPIETRVALIRGR